MSNKTSPLGEFRRPDTSRKTVVFHKIPKRDYARFKAACFVQGVQMRDVFIDLIRKYSARVIEETGNRG